MSYGEQVNLVSSIKHVNLVSNGEQVSFVSMERGTEQLDSRVEFY